MPQIIVQQEPHQRLVVELHRRESGEDDYWGGNWLVSRLTLSNGRFQGSAEATLHAAEFDVLRGELRGLLDQTRAHATFQSMEAVLAEPSTDTRLSTTFDLRRDQVEELLEAVDSVLTAFPIRGAPDLPS